MGISGEDFEDSGGWVGDAAKTVWDFRRSCPGSYTTMTHWGREDEAEEREETGEGL
jgi:hypothetical protein